MDTLVGTSIGGYTLVRLLGAGGMGSVYLANDPAIGQQVAVKVIRTDLDAYTDSAAAEMALERFRQEARAVAGLDHLHILPLYRYGEEPTPSGPRAYMIMQYRPEGSLWDWLRRRADFASGHLQPTQAELSSGLPTNWPLGLAEVTEYLQQASSALQYAHDRGIVHRDIKPANFLLRIDAHEKSVHLLLSDFGLAKVFTSTSATNTILGTPTYMAPEQFEGGARPESDQYALAVMVYYLLAGRAPFEGDPMQLMRQHMVADVPSITTFNPGIPPYMNGVLARALAKKPEQRFPSIAAFAEAFAKVAKPQSSSLSISPMTPSDSAWGAASPTYAAPTVMNQPPVPGRLGLPSNDRRAPGPLVLPGNPGPGMYNAPSPVPPTQPTSAAPGMYNTPAPTVYPAPAPNPQMAGGMYNNAQQQQFARTPDVYAQAPVAPGYAPQRPVEQKVSRRSALGWILGGAALVAAGGGVGAYFYLNGNGNGNGQPGTGSQSTHHLHTLAGHSAAVTSLNWGGGQLTTGSADKTVRFWSPADGTNTGTITTSAPVGALAWSLDGAKLATGASNRGLIEIWNANGSLLKSEPLWVVPIKALAWDNRYLYIGTNGNGLHALDSATRKRYGKNNPGVHVNGLALSPDGSSIALALESGTVYFADLSKNWAEVGTIPSAYGAALSVSWSPDGLSVVVGYEQNVAAIYDAASKQMTHKLTHSGSVYSVAWSPTSTQNVPVLASGDGNNAVNIWNLNQPKPVIYPDHTDAVLALAWSSDGKSLVSGSRDKTAIIWSAPA